jgi:hypothetical protein
MNAEDTEKRAKKTIERGLALLGVKEQAVNRAIHAVHFNARCCELAGRQRGSLFRYNYAAALALAAGLVIGAGMFGLVLLFYSGHFSSVAEWIKSRQQSPEEETVSTTLASVRQDKSRLILSEVEKFGRKIEESNGPGPAKDSLGTAGSIAMDFFSQEFRQCINKIISLLNEEIPSGEGQETAAER